MGNGFSKKNLLKQIFQAQQKCKMGYFLPANYKFSVQAPTPILEDSYTAKAAMSGDLEDSFSSMSLGDGVEQNASPQAEKLQEPEVDLNVSKARRGSKRMMSLKKQAMKK